MGGSHGRLSGAALLVVVMIGCSTGAPPVITPTPTPTVPDITPPQPTPTATPTATASATPTEPATVTVTSADGRVTVEVPADDPVAGEVAVEAMTAAEAPAELISAGVAQACYRLLPGNAVFEVAARITQTFARDAFGATAGTVSPFFQIIRSPEGIWEWLDDAEISYTEDEIAVTGTTDHFSTVCIFTDRTGLIIEPVAPRTDLVGTSFTRTVSLISQDERNNPIIIDEIATTSTGVIAIGAPLLALGADTFTQEWQCPTAGDYVGMHAIRIHNFAADNPFFTDTLGLGAPLEATIKTELPGECVAELPSGAVDRVCIEVFHDALGDFVSFLNFLLWFLGAPTDDFDYLEVIIDGANDDQPQRLELNADGSWNGQLGLRGAGSKALVSVIAHRRDGTTLDLTDTVADLIGGRTFNVRVPEEDKIGQCE